MTTTETRLITRLEDQGVEYELLPHRRVGTALDEARVLDVAPQEVAKTIVLATPDGYVRAVVPASERLDLQKVRAVLATGDVHLLSEPELVHEYPEFELGAVPPFGGHDDRVLIDPRLAGCETIVLEAGTHDESVRLRTDDLLALARAQLAEICID